MTTIGMELDTFREELRELLASDDVEEGLSWLEGEPTDLLGDEEVGFVCGVTGYGLANLQLAVLVRSPRLRLDFKWPLPSPLGDESQREAATKEIRLGLQLVYVALARAAVASAEGRCVEAHFAPDAPLVWRVIGADGDVERAGDDWGTFADLFVAAVESGDNATIIYP